MTQPTIQVLLDDAGNGGTFPYDITAYVRLVDGVVAQRGRADEFTEIQASTLALTVENDGRFTLGSTSGGYGTINVDRRIQYNVTANGVTTTRYTGYVQTWPVEWPDGGDTFAVAQVTAVDRLARLARKTLRSFIEEEVLLSGPKGYYTLAEAAGAAAAGDSSGLSAPQLKAAGTGTAVAFGATGGPTTCALTSATFSNGQYLKTTGLTMLSLVGPFIAGCFGAFVRVTGSGGNIFTAGDITLAYDGTLTAGATPITLHATGLNNGALHYVGVEYAYNTGGTAFTLKLYLDGTLVDSASGVGTGNIFGGSGFTVGQGLTGTLAHVALFRATSINEANISAAGTTGFAGETSGQRIGRLAGYAGVAAGDQVLESSVNASVPFVDITGESPASAITKVDDAEGGSVFFRGDGKLVMQNRSHRARQVTPDLTLTNNDIDPTCRLVADTQLVQNVVTASAGANGAVQTATNSASRTTHGDYPADLSGLLVATDDQALAAAQWRVGKYAEPFTRMPNLLLDLATLTATQQAAVMAVEISDRIQVTGLPSQAGSTTLDLITEGWTETLTADAWTWDANTSNWSTASAWILGDATCGVLDSTTTLGY